MPEKEPTDLPAGGEARAFRAGDHVRHLPSGEEWVLGPVEGAEAYALGWPCTLAKVADLELVEAASDAESLETLRRCAAISPERGVPDPRASAAMRALRAREGEAARHG